MRPGRADLHHGQSECSGAGYITADLLETNWNPLADRGRAMHSVHTTHWGVLSQSLRVNSRTRLAFAPGDALIAKMDGTR